MHRKVPVQFLGEGALATAPPYPTGHPLGEPEKGTAFAPRNLGKGEEM